MDGPLPSASSPQLLLHLLDMVSRGLRSVKTLEEALGVDPRTVRYYLQAGTWLGLLEGEGEPQLTAEGLAVVYAGASRRERYARVVRAHPFVVDLLGHAAGRPTAEDVRRAVARREPDAAFSTVERKASALRGLLAPCLDDVALDEGAHDQLALPLVQAPPLRVESGPAKLGGTSFGPDLVRLLLAALLDHGELTLGHVRGLLDGAGAAEAPLGGYVDHLIARGDAHRLGDHLVVSAAAARRSEVAASTAAVILSDAGWRAHLEGLRKGEPSGRWRPWDRRLFGHELDPSRLDAELHRVLRDRSLEGHACADGVPGAAPVVRTVPFVQVWAERGLLVTLPPSLAQAWEGAAGLNRHLRNARHRGDAVAVPSIVVRPVVAHGALLHPGETPPRSVPDARTLRQRLVACAPYVTMVVALLAAHRAEAPRIEVRAERGGFVVRRHRASVGGLLDVLDAFGRRQGWVVSRRLASGFGDARLVGLLERLGVAVVAGERLVLDETFFAHLRQGEEAALLGAPLAALGGALCDFVEGVGDTR